MLAALVALRLESAHRRPAAHGVQSGLAGAGAAALGGGKHREGEGGSELEHLVGCGDVKVVGPVVPVVGPVVGPMDQSFTPAACRFKHRGEDIP